MPRLLLHLSLLFALLPACGWAAALQTSDLPEPTVKVSNQDGTIVLDISYRVPVSPREAWAVLTDFENMPGFVPNLETSQVLQRSGKTVQIEQKGSINLGMFPVHYESRRQIEMLPYQRIRSHSLSGDTRLDSVMMLTPSGTGTILSYHATAVPDLPVPDSLVGSYMEEMLENQFKAMGHEMVKRSLEAQQAASQLASAKSSVKLPARQTPRKSRVQTKKRPG